jgi:hypothetical protein
MARVDSPARGRRCDHDHELYEDLQELVSTGQLEAKTPAHGIALQVVDDGYKSLSENQRAVYDSVIVPALEHLHRTRENDQAKNTMD